MENIDSNYDSVISLIENCQEKNNEISKQRDKFKKELEKLKNANRVVILLFILTCLIKFPKVYNYDFLLNFIAVILEAIAGLVIDTKNFLTETELNSTYIIQDFTAEMTLDATKNFLEEEKKALVKVK